MYKIADFSDAAGALIDRVGLCEPARFLPLSRSLTSTLLSTLPFISEPKPWGGPGPLPLALCP